MKDNLTIVAFPVEKEIDLKMRVQAATRRISKSELIRNALKAYLENLERKEQTANAAKTA